MWAPSRIRAHRHMRWRSAGHHRWQRSDLAAQRPGRACRGAPLAHLRQLQLNVIEARARPGVKRNAAQLQVAQLQLHDAL